MLMKKKITGLLLCLLTALPSLAQVVYSTSFETEDDFNAWKVYDVNQDEKTWRFSADADPRVYCEYNGAMDANDWLISPAITTETDAVLMVSYTFKGSYYGENMAVYYGQGDAVENMTTEGASYTNVNGDLQGGYFLLNAKGGESFNLGFKCFSLADKWRLSLASVEVKVANNPVDLKVDELISPQTGKDLGQETVKIRVSNQGFADAENYTLGYRIDDGEPVVENVKKVLAPGEWMEYEFSTPADLSIPRHLYNIKAFAHIDDDIDINNDTLVVDVRHKAPATVPYATSFEPTEDLSELTFLNLNNDEGTWSAYMSSGWFSMSRTGYGCLAYNYDKNNNGDDWAFLEPINVEEGYHALKFWYSATSGHPEKFAVYWGTEPTVEAMTNKIVEYNPALNDAYEESINIVNFDKAQTVYIGFHAFSDKDENWLTIDDLTLEKASSNSVDLTITDVVNPTDYMRYETDNDLKVEVRNIGIIDAEATVNVSLDDKSIKTADYTINAQEVKTISFEGLLAGLDEGKHNLKIELVCATDENPDNNVFAKELVVLGTPVRYYDFESGELPSDLTYEVKDGGTLNPSAGEEFNEYGWGIFNLQEHAILGSHVLAGATWLDNTDKADRWVYFPRVKVTGENAYFVWNANSFNPLYLEDYSIMVCDDPYSEWGVWFSTATTIYQESIYTKTRGIDMGKYVGKEVDVAIRLISKNCEALILDNIGFYGDISTDVTSGIDRVQGQTFVAGDNMVGTGNANDTITLYDASGRMVGMGQGNADVSQLQPGVYMATVKTATGSRTVKFVKK